VIEARLVGRHLVGHWRNDSDARYFGAVQLAALPGENVLAGQYTSQACLRDPVDLAELLDAHSQPYSPPLPLAAIVEEPQT
jgi:hypothetical protein